jgi:DNA-binding NarL/FixJ family response regulator
MSEHHSKKSVIVCDTQPITAEGLRSLLASAPDLEFLASLNSLDAATPLVNARTPDVVIVDKGFGLLAVLDWIRDFKLTDTTSAITVWGVSMTEAEAMGLFRAGARGIVRKTAELESILSCLRMVVSGQNWIDDSLFPDSARQGRYPRPKLTSRERQVREMVEQGFRNKDIGMELGIRPGTVKLHVRHILEKTGERGRFGLAISGLRERRLVSTVS